MYIHVYTMNMDPIVYHITLFSLGRFSMIECYTCIYMEAEYNM